MLAQETKNRPPTHATDQSRLLTFPETNNHNAHSHVDSDWGNDKAHKQSVTGMAHMMAGGVMACKSKFQATVAPSSTEAEFAAAAEAGKTMLCLQSILQELGCEQHEPTTLCFDNQGALFMANAEQPIQQTRHMDTKNFAIQQWTKEEHMVLKPIATQDNASDHFSKAPERTKFCEQIDALMGRRKPNFKE